MAPRRHPSRWVPWPPALLALLLACLLPELLLSLSDRGLVATPVLRRVAYLLGAFDPGLLSGAQRPVFAAQPVTMFLSYGLLHTGLLHMIGNLAALLYLGRLTLERRRARSLWAIWALSTLSAAAIFALIGPERATMVGASGALFGLLGAWAVDSGLVTPKGAGAAPRPVAQLLRLLACAAALIAFDIAGHALTGGPVAWQAHTGGFLGGALFALLAPVPARRRA